MHTRSFFFLSVMCPNMIILTEIKKGNSVSEQGIINAF